MISSEPRRRTALNVTAIDFVLRRFLQSIFCGGSGLFSLAVGDLILSLERDTSVRLTEVVKDIFFPFDRRETGSPLQHNKRNTWSSRKLIQAVHNTRKRGHKHKTHRIRYDVVVRTEPRQLMVLAGFSLI